MTRLAIFLLGLILSAAAFAEDPWWETETRMSPGGKLSLSDKPWWPEASNLSPGEHLVLQSAYAKEAGGEGKMLLRKEVRKRDSNKVMLVWVLDDDGDLTGTEGDADSDCYVVDYDADGTVDRMVDTIDSDGDNDPDEMDIRYFVEGELRRSWMGIDLDDDSAMWDLRDYEYTGDFFASDPYGDNMIYMNRYDPEREEWLPISECPFAFFDTDGDGESEVVARFSAAPLDFSEQSDPDYANSQDRYQGPFYPSLRNPGVVNIRYSFDIDGLSSKERPLHYEMGFNLVGGTPYSFTGMKHFQPLRRSPKTTICAPHKAVRGICEKYSAKATGFTWREFEDAGMKIGDPTWPESDRRWEGVFWTWSRRVMHNTGGPIQDWNVRREYDPNPSRKRELYFSPVDRRIHLKGAREGWQQVGHIGNTEPMGEIRLFDTDENGYFDRWEYYFQESSTPYRVAVVPVIGNHDLALDKKRLRAFFTEEVLPEAIRLNEALIARLEQLHPLPDDPTVRRIREAISDRISPDEKRYLLDLIRERLFRAYRD
ncbi:MAG: hypothetical protein HUU16_19155, partial [Candidatus Omnitrophica bacterium]|nr:hypothetical protein [Candidatus Omnitrophota bacterium]